MRKILKRLGIVLAILLLLCVTYTVSSKWIIKHFIISGNYDMAVLIYNNQIYRGLWNDECEQLFNEQINNINTDFFVDDDLSEENFLNDYDNKYNNTIDKLVVLSSIKNQYISQLAMDLRELVDKEYKGRIKLIEAETEYQKEKYVECLKIITDISDDFSLTDSVDELKNDCISEVLYSISNPNSVEEYEKYISLSDECIAICSDKQLVDRKKELENELVDFKNVVGYIEDAESYIDKGDFINAVKVLNNPTKDYPNEKHLSLALEDCQSYLIFYVGESVNKYLENKEYKEALSLIEEAQNVYSCEDLDTLHDHVKTISSPWYRFKTTVVDKTKSIIDYFKKDVTNVKQEGGVAYIYRSGEKIILGDYSKKDVSLLSVTGSGLLSIIGVDVPLDIRDLSYDVQHIGEEDDWLVWLAVDTVALLPVVGTVKYIKYAKKTGKIADSVSDVSKIADDVSDAAKNVDNVSDASKVADNVSDAAKGVDVISDVARVTERIDEIKDVKLGKIADKPKLFKHYEHIDTINQSLKGGKHAVTGVPFRKQKIKLSDGRRVKGVFPKFDYAYECKLPQNMLKETDAKQFAKCNEQLKKAIEKNPSLADKFTERQLEQIKNGDKISGFTWHHNEKEGIMQLVDSEVHNATNHTGGRNIWGGGTSAR